MDGEFRKIMIKWTMLNIKGFWRKLFFLTVMTLLSFSLNNTVWMYKGTLVHTDVQLYPLLLGTPWQARG